MVPAATGAVGALVLEEACIAKLLYARRACVETSADVAGVAVANLTTSDLNTIPVESAYHAKLTEIRRSNMISG